MILFEHNYCSKLFNIFSLSNFSCSVKALLFPLSNTVFDIKTPSNKLRETKTVTPHLQNVNIVFQTPNLNGGFRLSDMLANVKTPQLEK